MKPVKVVVSGYIGFDNFGDESILEVLLDNLKQQGCSITVISSNPQKTALLHGVKSCKTFSLINILFNLIHTDILISGGGSLLQDKTSLKSLFYYLFIILCAKLFHKKVIIFAQGIGPINNKFAQWLTKFVLKKCDLHSVRDEKSLFLLRGWGIDAMLQSDPVFNLDIPNYLPQNKLGIQLRSWKHLTTDFLDVLADEIANKFPNHEVLIFSFQDTQDYKLCKEFQTKLALRKPQIKTEIIQNNYQHNLIENFKNLEYLIAMCFHACLLAIKFGIKTLAINYDEKVEKLAKESGIPCINLDEQDKLDKKIQEMKTLNESALLEFAQSQQFNFSKINNLINSVNDPIRHK